MAHLVKHPILDFGSGHNLRVPDFEPCILLSAVSAELASDPLSHLPHSGTLSKINKHFKNKNKKQKKTMLKVTDRLIVFQPCNSYVETIIPNEMVLVGESLVGT